MSILLLSDLQNEKPYRRIQITLDTPTTGDWIVLDSLEPGFEATIGLLMKPTGEGYWNFTNEDIESIQDGTVNANQWTQGSVTVDTFACYPSGITAVQPVNVSGTTKFTVSV